MAQVPTVTAPNLTPPPEMNPRIAGGPGRVLEGIGETFGAISEYGERESSLLKKAQDEGIMLAAENQIGADMEQAESELSRWTDYTHAEELKQKVFDNLQQKYGDQYGDRPDLWRNIQPYLDRQLNTFNATVDRQATKLTTDFNKGALFDAQLRAENEAATEPTLEGKEQIWGIQDAKTDAMARNGTIGFDQAEIAKKQLRSRTIATEVDRAANPMNAPEIMESEMQRLREYEGKGYVDPKELEQMQDHLAVAYERAVTRADRVDVSKVGDTVIASLKADPTLKDPETREFDQMAAAKKVDDNPDISTKVKKYVRSELEEEAGVAQKQINERDQKMLDDLDPAVERGQLTFAQLTHRENLPPGSKDWIPRRVADHLLSKAAQLARQERALKNQEEPEESKEIVAVLGSRKGYLTKADILGLMSTYPKLKYSDALHVVEIRSAQADPYFQAGMDMFKQAANQGVMTIADYGEANIALLKASQNGLTGDQLIKYAQDIVKPNAEKDIKKRLDNILNPGAAQPSVPAENRGSIWQSIFGEGRPQKPPNVPDGWIHKTDGPQGSGWYPPETK